MPEGKLLAASLLDNHNRIVPQIRHKPALVQATSGSSQANTQASIRATPLAPAVAAVPKVVVQPAVAWVQVSNCAPPTAAPHPSPLAMNGVDPQLLRASGYYAGQLSGVLSGPETLNFQPDGYMGGTVNVVG